MITIAERRKIARLVLTTDDEIMIKKIISLLTLDKKRDEFIKQYNQEIDDAVARVKSGRYYTGEEADILLEEWAKKQ